jgi:hypothetical protein
MNPKTAYSSLHAEALVLMHRLEKQLEQGRRPPEALGWGHVGHLAGVVGHLKEILGETPKEVRT